MNKKKILFILFGLLMFNHHVGNLHSEPAAETVTLAPLSFTKPHITVPTAIIARQNDNRDNRDFSLPKMSAMTVAMEAGDEVQSFQQTTHPTIKMIGEQDDPMELRQVSFELLLVDYIITAIVTLLACFAWYWNRKLQKEIIERKKTEQALLRSHNDLKQAESLLAARLRLSELASHVDLKKLMQATIDEAEIFTGSNIGFFLFIADDQENLVLQAWSTNTITTMCTAEGKDKHYPISQAGVWADCFYQHGPVIHQDYASLPHKKGMPKGHVPITRELTLPIERGEKIKAIIGVGNKANEYNEEDIKLVKELASFSFDLIERKRAEEETRKTKREWENTFDAMHDIVTIQDTSLRVIRANKAAHEILGFKPGELTGKHCYEIFRGMDHPCLGCPELQTLQDRKIHTGNITHKRLEKIFNVTGSPILNEKGEVLQIVHIARDVTQQKKMEEELVQAHKLEAIGTLAGGVAHDFNNILAAIMGHADMARYHLPTKSPVKDHIEQVLKACNRAKELVQQILTFSRKGQETQQALQPTPLIKEAIKLIRASLPTTVVIREEFDSDCGVIMANPTNMHQVLVNLCTNALHAMEDEKGVLTVKLSRVEFQESDLSAHEREKIAPGPFVELMVSDTGCGMNKETMSRIFEPYYTTKEKGKGSGMGLALVHGIVQGSQGFIRVESTPGQGSTFYAYFPVVEKQLAAIEVDSQEPLPGGKERILAVDDEEIIIRMYQGSLDLLGYNITVHLSSEKTLKEFRAAPDNFDLIITDQTMPGLTGSELAREVLKIRPDIPIILCTGYSSMISEEKAQEIGITKFLMKPTSVRDLAITVREALDKKKKNGSR